MLNINILRYPVVNLKGLENQSLWQKLNSFRFQLKLNIFTGKMFFAKISKMWIEKFFSEKSFCETNCFDKHFVFLLLKLFTKNMSRIELSIWHKL